MRGVEVAVGGTDEATDRIMSALVVVALEERGATVLDRSGTEGSALNRDDLAAGRLDIVPEDIGTGWFIHLGQTEQFARTTELLRSLRELDRSNGIMWSEQSLFDDALAAVADSDAVTGDDGEVISVLQLSERLSNSFDAVVCLDRSTLESPDGLVRFERATGFTIPAEQLEVLEADVLIDAVAEDDCTVAFVPGIDPRIGDRGLAVIDRFAPAGLRENIFIPRNASYMVDAEFATEWAEWWTPFAESLMASLDGTTMTMLKADLANGDAVSDIARDHLEKAGLL